MTTEPETTLGKVSAGNAPPPYYTVAAASTNHPLNAPDAPPYPPPYSPTDFSPMPNCDVTAPPEMTPGYPVLVSQPGPMSVNYPHTVVQVQPYVMYRNSRQFVSTPAHVTCSHCHSNIITELEFVSGLLTWIICLVLIFFGMWYFCCLIPFCIDDCKDVIHRCPNCKSILGIHKRISSQW